MSGPRFGATNGARLPDIEQWQQAPQQQQREEPAPRPTPTPPPPQQEPQAVYPNNIRVLPQVAPRPSYKWLLWLAGGMALAFFILYLLSEGEKEEVREQRRETDTRGRDRRDYDDRDDREYDNRDRRESSSRGRDDRDDREYRTRRDDGTRNTPAIPNILPIVVTPPAQSQHSGQGNGGTNS